MSLLWVLACAGKSGDDSSAHHSDSAQSDSGDGTDSADSVDTTVDSGGDSAIVWAPLELCINEFMPENDATIADDLGLYPDWIELHNPGTTPIDLEGWSLEDDRDDVGDNPLASQVLLPGGFAVFWADSSVSPAGNHLGFALSGDGGEVGLFAPDGRGSVVTYGKLAADFAAARVTDCCTGPDCFEFVFHGTPGSTNTP